MVERQAKYMLDTNICIYIQKENPPSVLKKFETLKPDDMVISTVTWGELQYGVARSQKKQQVLKILDEFTSLVPVCEIPCVAGKVYGEIRAALAKQGTQNATKFIKNK